MTDNYCSTDMESKKSKKMIGINNPIYQYGLKKILELENMKIH